MGTADGAVYACMVGQGLPSCHNQAAGPLLYLRFNCFFTRLISLSVQYLSLCFPTLTGLGAVTFRCRIQARSVEGLTRSILANSGVVFT